MTDECDKYLKGTIKTLNLAEVNLMGLPGPMRKRTLELEEKMTIECNKGNLDGFYDLMDKWRSILMTGREDKEPSQGKLFNQTDPR